MRLLGSFDEEIDHEQLGLIRTGTVSCEYYWLDRWYNVFRFHEPDGRFRNFYCNINMPPTLKRGVLDYVDLDIDVLIYPDSGIQILDMEEFESNALKYGYDRELKTRARSALAELLDVFEKKHFPFNDPGPEII